MAQQLNWFRMDNGFADHPKLLALTDREFRAHVASMGYTSKHGLDGFIPPGALRTMGATPAMVRKFIRVRLWLPSDDDGWDINDWTEYQPSPAEAIARSERARNAANKRWGKGPHHH